jgi:predicted ATP-dependent endonuclease of OLD family
MAEYYIQDMKINKLWGYRDINLEFKKDVNIIIGPNASGKTTILNLLRYIFSADFVNLRGIEFEKIEIGLKSFDEKSKRSITVQSNEIGYKFSISQKTYDVDLESLLRHEPSRSSFSAARLYAARYRHRFVDLEQALNQLVKAVWLPVSRRLPISDDEELRPNSAQLESVDVRLRELLKELQTYRLSLEQKLSLQYKDFEKNVLSEILYSKEYDQLGNLSMDMPKPEEKAQLLRAFQVAGLLDSSMKKRIDEHFKVATQAVNTLGKFVNQPEGANKGIPLEPIFIMPLIRRTKSIVQYARKLEEDRNILFEPINTFVKLVNSYLNPKTVSIQDSGEIFIQSPTQQILSPHMLSSGEKQILILLIQAIVRESEPIIYVADEPELSLHVTWQENLLKSLMQLTKQIQIIVATHSPDIVGPYKDRVIDLGKIP